MKKFNFLSILAFAIFLPVFVASCGNKEDLIGNYELEQKGIKTILGDNKDVEGIKMSLNDNDSATFTLCMAGIPTPDNGENVKIACDMVLKGTWEYSGFGQKLTLKMTDAELKNIKYVSDDKAMQELLNSKPVTKITEELVKKEFNADEFKKNLGELPINISEIQDDGFTIKGKDDEEAKFKKVK